MEWLSDERLFYGGMAVALISLVIALIYFFISRRGKKRLEERMDEEYGKQPKGDKRN